MNTTQPSDSLADDPRTIPQLARLGILSDKDRATLRRLSGDLTLAEWCSDPKARQRGPYRLRDRRLLLVMAVRVKATQEARSMARLAPWLLVPAVAR